MERFSEKEEENRRIAHVTWFFVALFICMILSLGYFTYFRAPDFINSSYNHRQKLYAERVVRGSILSRDGEVLAETVVGEDGSEKRVYPYRNIFAHAVGFTERGNTGAEYLTNFSLLESDCFIGDRLSNALNGRKNPGNNAITTLDTGLQEAAYKALSNYRGAVIALDAKTGEILCMVSKPDFDPEKIDLIWDDINADTEKGALVNRAMLGLYPPGSTFKIVTMLEYLKENEGEALEDFEFDCKGSFEYEGYTINCYHKREHGKLDITDAFAQSCNSAFASLGVSLDKNSFRKTCEKLLFNKDLPLKLPYRQSCVPINSESDTGELLQTAIGQGKTQATPLHIAMITQAIANGGVLMKPYLIDSIESSDGRRVKSFEPSRRGSIMDKKYALKLKELMTEVVENGTATRLKNSSYTVAGKTGSAEFSENKAMSHAWFTGFAPAEDPQIVVTVIAEKAGTGGGVAVPMAKAVFDEYFR